MLSRLFLLAAVAAALAGCGKQGDLQRPGPLFGQPRAVLPSDLERGAPDETSEAENQDEDDQNPIPNQGEQTRPRDPNNPPSPAAPVNIPPT
jgi:predicted small lipoprotein YifL